MLIYIHTLFGRLQLITIASVANRAVASMEAIFYVPSDPLLQ